MIDKQRNDALWAAMDLLWKHRLAWFGNGLFFRDEPQQYPFPYIPGKTTGIVALDRAYWHIKREWLNGGEIK